MPSPQGARPPAAIAAAPRRGGSTGEGGGVGSRGTPKTGGCGPGTPPSPAQMLRSEQRFVPGLACWSMISDVSAAVSSFSISLCRRVRFGAPMLLGVDLPEPCGGKQGGRGGHVSPGRGPGGRQAAG